MAYDPLSTEALKGTIGEHVVKTFLESRGYDVRKPDDTFKSGASIVDFFCTHPTRTNFFAEVKVRTSYPYGTEDAPCYFLPVAQLEAYKKYSNQQRTPLVLYIVDYVAGFCYAQDLHMLGKQQTINGRTFPILQKVPKLGGRCCYWHQEQFTKSFAIPEADIEKLQALVALKKKVPDSTNKSLEEKELENPIEEMIPVGEATLAEYSCRIWIDKEKIFWVAAMDYQSALSNSKQSGFQRQSATGQLLQSESAIKSIRKGKGSLFVLNVEVLMKQVLPKLMNGELTNKKHLKERAKLILRDLATAHQSLTAEQDKTINTVSSENAVNSPARLTGKEIFNMFAEAFNVNKNNLAQLILKEKQAQIKELLS